MLDDEFPGGETTVGLIVYERQGGLTAADEEKIVADAKAAEALSEEELPLTEPPAVPFGPGRRRTSWSRPTATSPTRC